MKIFEKIQQHIAEAEKFLNSEETAGYFYLSYLQSAKQELEQAEVIIKEFQKDTLAAINKYKTSDESPRNIFPIDTNIKLFSKELEKLKPRVEYQHKLYRLISTRPTSGFYAVDFFELDSLCSDEKLLYGEERFPILHAPETVSNTFRAQFSKLKFDGHDLRELEATQRQLTILELAISTLKIIIPGVNLKKEIEDGTSTIAKKIAAAKRQLEFLSNDVTFSRLATISQDPKKAAATIISGAAAPPAADHKSVVMTDSKTTTAAVAAPKTKKFNINVGDVFDTPDDPDTLPLPTPTYKSPVQIATEAAIAERKSQEQKKQTAVDQKQTAAAKSVSPSLGVSKPQIGGMSPFRLTASPKRPFLGASAAVVQHVTAADTTSTDSSDAETEDENLAIGDSVFLSHDDEPKPARPRTDPTDYKSSAAAGYPVAIQPKTEPVLTRSAPVPTPFWTAELPPPPQHTDSYRIRMLPPVRNPKAIAIPKPVAKATTTTAAAIATTPELVPGAPPKQLTQ